MSFDLSSIDDFTQYERTAGEGGSKTLPVGFYRGIITRADMKDTKDNTGKYLDVEFDITSPDEFSNRKFWAKFNLVNKSAVTVKIAKEHLGELIKALGFAHSPNTDELLGREASLYLAVDPAKNGYSESNKCMKYMSANATEDDYHNSKPAAKVGAGVIPERKSWGAAPTVVAQPVAAAKASWKNK
jgi:hypothetical protein